MTFDLVGQHEMASKLFDSYHTDFVFAGASDGVSGVVPSSLWLSPSAFSVQCFGSVAQVLACMGVASLKIAVKFCFKASSV